jgi:hypothetical protein
VISRESARFSRRSHVAVCDPFVGSRAHLTGFCGRIAPPHAAPRSPPWPTRSTTCGRGHSSALTSAHRAPNVLRYGTSTSRTPRAEREIASVREGADADDFVVSEGRTRAHRGDLVLGRSGVSRNEVVSFSEGPGFTKRDRLVFGSAPSSAKRDRLVLGRSRPSRHELVSLSEGLELRETRSSRFRQVRSFEKRDRLVLRRSGASRHGSNRVHG